MSKSAEWVYGRRTVIGQAERHRRRAVNFAAYVVMKWKIAFSRSPLFPLHRSCRFHPAHNYEFPSAGVLAPRLAARGRLATRRREHPSAATRIRFRRKCERMQTIADRVRSITIQLDANGSQISRLEMIRNERERTRTKSANEIVWHFFLSRSDCANEK